MKGTLNKAYGIGALLVLIGGVGLAEINVNNDVGFWLFAIVFSLGVGLCVGNYRNG